MKAKMPEKTRPSNVAGSSVFAKLAAEKKKTIAAVCLLTVMAFMWIKVFVGEPPQSAEAAEDLKASPEKQALYEQDEESLKSKMSYVELPKVRGRNDVLTRDFFSVNDKGLYQRTEKEIKPVSNGNDDEEMIRRISEKLTLKAIALGQNPQAFINDKLFGIGSILTVTEGNNLYECEVTKIEETEVTIRCGEGIITLKISHPSEVLN